MTSGTTAIEEEKRQFERDYYDHHNTDCETLDRVLFTTIEALNQARIEYALIGGVAVRGLGRPRVTNDIDIFVTPDQSERVLDELAKRGFETEKRDPHWLFKAWRDDILVDIIFKSTGGIYFDDQMRKQVKTVNYKNVELKAVSPEDFIVIKSAAHQEVSPQHWFDALAVLVRGQINWEYLIDRARHAPRRVLSLLIYGQSIDIGVPDEVIVKLMQSLYSPQLLKESS